MSVAAAVAVVAVLLLAAFPGLRRLAWLAVRGAVGAVLALLAYGVERRRTRRQPPAVGGPEAGSPRPRPSAPRCWRVRLSVRVDGYPVTLADGEVVGPWSTAAEVRAEALHRWAEAGGWPIGDRRVFAEAWPAARVRR